jgi:hypothetical protein
MKTECRFNERKDNNAGRFVKAVSGYIGKGLRYAKLIGQDGDSLSPGSGVADDLNR